MNNSVNNIPRTKTASPFLRFSAILALVLILAQPLAALADDTTITDANNAQNPADQSVTSGSTDNVPVVTQATYSTSTPDTTDPDTDQSPTSTEPSIGNSTTTPDSSATTTPDSTDATSTPDSQITPCDGSPTSTPDSSGSNQPCDSGATTSEDSILPDAGSADATSTAADDSTTTIDLLNSNNLDATTTATTTANTGLNNTLANGDLNFATTTTGTVNVYANVLTIANTNLVNSQIEEINNNFNQLAASLYLNQPELSAGQRTQDLVSPICSSNGLTCQSITTFKLTNQNTANLDNNISAAANSGGNQEAANGGDVAESSISTGNVNAVVNVLNIVNTNAVNSTWTIVTFNVFGNWQGDLVMPSQLYFSNLMSVGAQQNSAISQVQSVILNVNNTNQSSINNNVVVQTDTGNNVIASVPDASGSTGDVNDASIQTGTSTAESNVQNLTNVTLYNSNWFLGLVNIMGSWSGNVYSLPNSVGVNYEPNGFQFVSSSDSSAQAQLLAELQPTNATSTNNGTASPTNPDSTGPADSSNQQNFSTDPNATSTPDSSGPVDSTSTTASEVDLTNTNQAVINNNITVDATTGQNDIASVGGDADNNSITTGSATALANVLNFANANLVNSNLYIGLVNIYGDWQGNIVFGYPDLAVTQSADQTQVPGGVNSPLNVNANFSNQGTGSMAASQMEWKFDPTLFSLAGVAASSTDPSTNNVQATTTYQTLAPGDIQVNLGNLDPNQAGNVSFQLQTLQDQTNGPADTFFAHIFGTGPEINLTNNQNTLTLTPATGTPVTTDNNNSNNDDNNNNSNPPPSGGGGGGGGGSPTGPTGTAIGTASNILRVSDTNSAAAPVKPGDTIHFTVLVDNDGNNKLHSLVAYENLLGPDGSTVSSNTYNVPDMASLDEYKIAYDLTISSAAAPGVYTDSVNAQGLNDALLPVKTTFSGNSSFTVINPGYVPSSPGAGGGAGVQSNNQTSKTTNSPTSPVTNQVNNSTTAPNSNTSVTSHSAGQVLGTSCTSPAFGANLQLGSTNAAVKALQIYLNKNGFALAKTGAGSPGHETTFFGSISKTALIKFQNANHIKPSGALDTLTRTTLNNLLNTSGLPFCSLTQPTTKTTPAVTTTLAMTTPTPPVVSNTINKIIKKPLPPKPVIKNFKTITPVNPPAPVVPVITNINPVVPTSPQPTPSPKASFWSGLIKHLGW